MNVEEALIINSKNQSKSGIKTAKWLIYLLQETNWHNWYGKALIFDNYTSIEVTYSGDYLFWAPRQKRWQRTQTETLNVEQRGPGGQFTTTTGTGFSVLQFKWVMQRVTLYLNNWSEQLLPLPLPDQHHEGYDRDGSVESAESCVRLHPSSLYVQTLSNL